MDNEIPTTEEVRYTYSTAWWDDFSMTNLDDPGGVELTAEYGEEFDAWLKQHNDNISRMMLLGLVQHLEAAADKYIAERPDASSLDVARATGVQDAAYILRDLAKEQ